MLYLSDAALIEYIHHADAALHWVQIFITEYVSADIEWYIE